jgi:hypothetical protein
MPNDGYKNLISLRKGTQYVRRRLLRVVLLTGMLAQHLYSDAGGQKTFELEEPFQRPVPVPQRVVTILRSALQNFDCGDGKTFADVSASWFTAADVRLNGSGLPALVVKASQNGACLDGANIGPFWVFEHRGYQYNMLLNENALVLTVLDSFTNGYHDIQLNAALGGGRYVGYLKYEFRRGQYRLASRRTVRAN